MNYLLAAVSLLTLTSTAAFAGEGNGNPFPFTAGSAIVADVPTAPTQTTGQTPMFTKMPPNSVPYGNRVMASNLRQYASVPMSEGALLPEVGSQGAVQTANSLPSGFENGTVPYEQAQSVQRYFAEQQSPASAGTAYAQATVQTGGSLASTSNGQGEPQPANSLPPGFNRGTAAGQHHAELRHYWSAQPSGATTSRFSRGG